MAPRRCSRCPRIIGAGSICDACRRTEWKVRNDDRPIRRAVVAASPICSTPGCGSTTDLTADHVIPLARGGVNEGPRRVLCRSCNARKGKRVDDARITAETGE